MESDKLRGEYKKAMETIDLSKDSRDRILSNIRLEDLSVPAETVKTKKRIPLFVILPVAGAAFAALIIGAILLAAGSSTAMKQMSADAPRTHSADIATAGKIEEEVDSVISGGMKDEGDKTENALGPDINANGALDYKGNNIKNLVPATRDGEQILGKLGFLPFEKYSENVVLDLRYGSNVRKYVEDGGSNDVLTVIVSAGINDIGGGVVELRVAGRTTILYGSTEDGIYNKALYLTEDNLFVVIESANGYSQDIWEKIVAGADIEK